jgi:hypothetical protein
MNYKSRKELYMLATKVDEQKQKKNQEGGNKSLERTKRVIAEPDRQDLHLGRSEREMYARKQCREGSRSVQRGLIFHMTLTNLCVRGLDS